MASCALAPFDHAKADVILRSADGVEFRVFKLFLSLASPFFETMFDLPQAPEGDTDQEMKDGLAVITMSEDSKTLDSFLRFCYPSTLAEDPSLKNLADSLSVLAVARKYSLDLIERKVCQALVNPKVLKRESLSCFAIARNARLKHETITAARSTLREPLIPAWFPEINLITSSDFLSLLTYHKECAMAVQVLMNDFTWITDYYRSESACTWLFGPRYNGNCCCGQSSDGRYFLWGNGPVPWWTTYMQEIFELLMDRPCGDLVAKETEKTIQKVRSGNCSGCSLNVKANMTEFSALLALRVEEKVASIELQMDF